ncbi:MAG TPA: tetratricopeptide repeat protein [Terriglobales bacterium]|nr:tetratricopeptide repeat protein [Terriglobales bacterium]
MKRRWMIVAIASMALIGAGILVRTERNNRRFAKWAAEYRIRAERGNAKSQWALGAMYDYGKGVPKDYAEALRWYRKSAEQGDAKGEYALALMYHEGKGLPQDDSESARWCRKAAEHGNALV